MATGVGDHSPRAQGAVRNCALKKNIFLSLQIAAAKWSNTRPLPAWDVFISYFGTKSDMFCDLILALYFAHAISYQILVDVI